jgi:protein gp37
MAYKSLIEWTESTWNPITGCTKVSDGCLNCYAERMANRLKAMGQKKYKNGFKLTLHPENIEEPLKFKKPQIIFVCSMSDIFHKNVPDEFILKLFEVMNKAHWHIFQVLTKRAERLESLAEKINWTKNIWMGVTVESEKYINRISYLQKTKAYIKFISIEPMLGPINNLPLDGIDWVIVGGESGPNARPIYKEWVENILLQCRKNEVAFFFKQWGGVNKKKNGRLLNGRTYDEMPKKLEIFNNSLF